MNFQVPQFIETEDKLFGPLTLRQFIYLAIAGGISALAFLAFEKPLAIAITVVLMGLAALLALVKINGRSMAVYLGAAIKYFWNPQVYMFKAPGAGEKIKALSDSREDVSKLKKLGEELATSKSAVPKRELALPPETGVKPKDERYEIVRKITGDAEAARRVDYR